LFHVPLKGLAVKANANVTLIGKIPNQIGHMDEEREKDLKQNRSCVRRSFKDTAPSWPAQNQSSWVQIGCVVFVPE